MPFNDQKIIRDVDRWPVPQYFNPETNQYESIEGKYGANSFIEKGRIVKAIFSGSTTTTQTFAENMYGLGIINDGTADLSVTINDITFTVKPGESFDDLFEAFTSVTVTGDTTFRAVVRQ